MEIKPNRLQPSRLALKKNYPQIIGIFTHLVQRPDLVSHRGSLARLGRKRRVGGYSPYRCHDWSSREEKSPTERSPQRSRCCHIQMDFPDIDDCHDTTCPQKPEDGGQMEENSSSCSRQPMNQSFAKGTFQDRDQLSIHQIKEIAATQRITIEPIHRWRESSTLRRTSTVFNVTVWRHTSHLVPQTFCSNSSPYRNASSTNATRWSKTDPHANQSVLDTADPPTSQDGYSRMCEM